MAETIAESAILWYNFSMTKYKTYQENYTLIQMKFPVDLEKIIEISDPIYTFNEIMNEVDLRKYLVVKGNKVGRPRLDSIKLLKNRLIDESIQLNSVLLSSLAQKSSVNSNLTRRAKHIKNLQEIFIRE